MKRIAILLTALALVAMTSPEVQNDSHVHRIKNQLKNQLK